MQFVITRKIQGQQFGTQRGVERSMAVPHDLQVVAFKVDHDTIDTIDRGA